MNEHECEHKPEFVQIKRYIRSRCWVPVWWLHIEHRATDVAMKYCPFCGKDLYENRAD